MDISPNGIAFITKYEGVKLNIYLDSVGKPTVGVGHLLTDDDKSTGKFLNGITEQQAEDLLHSDLAHVISTINALNISLTQNEFDALSSLIFNIGVGNFASSTIKRCLLAGDFQAAADALLMWSKAGGQTVEGLLTRRNDERTLFLS